MLVGTVVKVGSEEVEELITSDDAMTGISQRRWVWLRIKFLENVFD